MTTILILIATLSSISKHDKTFRPYQRFEFLFKYQLDKVSEFHKIISESH